MKQRSHSVRPRGSLRPPSLATCCRTPVSPSQRARFTLRFTLRRGREAEGWKSILVLAAELSSQPSQKTAPRLLRGCGAGQVVDPLRNDFADSGFFAGVQPEAVVVAGVQF